MQADPRDQGVLNERILLKIQQLNDNIEALSKAVADVGVETRKTADFMILSREKWEQAAIDRVRNEAEHMLINRKIDDVNRANKIFASVATGMAALATIIAAIVAVIQ